MVVWELDYLLRTRHLTVDDTLICQSTWTLLIIINIIVRRYCLFFLSRPVMHIYLVNIIWWTVIHTVWSGYFLEMNMFLKKIWFNEVSYCFQHPSGRIHANWLKPDYSWQQFLCLRITQVLKTRCWFFARIGFIRIVAKYTSTAFYCKHMTVLFFPFLSPDEFFNRCVLSEPHWR